MAKPKLFIPDDKGYFWPFDTIFSLTDDIKTADVLMLTGGADVDPWYYGQKRGQYTLPNPHRDFAEKELYSYAVGRKMPILGICRGAQFLCVMQGGQLVQHLHGHMNGDHQIMTKEGKEYEMSSSHHQMMLPGVVEHELIAWTERLSPYYLNGNNEKIEGIETEPEIIFFPGCDGLGIQGHPEYLYPNHPTVDYVCRLVRERLV